ncbi:hypothetical protein C1T17_02770 [Sphingobium sp. SCG-1]|uniref:CmcJ/NvfI family oxidoreductase n=1 Tax=Sphingobium sp. SCG-1 TaxID=2072936 RepID=UPI000CD69FC7|nr:CmcJ/NvfI family oxidoreductase [Sphingobium sp. SCG-1]AUW57169.1 hypothetical protein C1T17_02770 [Sphingobium sp. SCG-1]
MAPVLEQIPLFRVVEIEMNFCGATQEKGEPTVVHKASNINGRNPNRNAMKSLQVEPHIVTLLDGSSISPDLDLDREGFICRHHPSAVTDFKDKQQVRDVYQKELRAFFQSLTGADIVEFPEAAGNFRSSEPQESEGGAAFMAHLDFTENGALYAVEQELPDRTKDISRWAFIKVWRSLSPAAPVDAPLAVLDARTLMPEDIFPTDVRYPHIPGVTESAALHFNPDHRWVYFSDMKRDDVIIFKTFDSDPHKARMVGHGAFLDKTAPANATRRSSFELRAYVAWST